MPDLRKTYLDEGLHLRSSEEEQPDRSDTELESDEEQEVNSPLACSTPRQSGFPSLPPVRATPIGKDLQVGENLEEGLSKRFVLHRKTRNVKKRRLFEGAPVPEEPAAKGNTWKWKAV